MKVSYYKCRENWWHFDKLTNASLSGAHFWVLLLYYIANRFITILR